MRTFILTVAFTLIYHFGLQAQAIAKYDSLQHNMGTIKQGLPKVIKVKVQNVGREPLIFTNCTSSCGCVVVNCPRDPIMPSKFAIVDIAYNAAAIGAFNKQVTLHSNSEPDGIVVVSIYGIVVQ